MTTPIPEPPVPYDGCLWPVDPACLGTEWAALDESIQERALALASSTLERLTGYRVSNCPTTVRPCQRGGCWGAFVPSMGLPPTWLSPGVTQSGSWVNACGCSDGCASDCAVSLPGPVGPVTEVLLDGLVVDPADYRVEDGMVVWQGGGVCPWPTSQDMNLPLGEEGTFGITYLNAIPVDSNGAWQVGILALEFAKACTGKGKCSLPTGVTQVARNGVTMTIATGAFPGGKTGLRTVDAYISLYNPRGLVQDSTVWTPGQRRTRTIGGR